MAAAYLVNWFSTLCTKFASHSVLSAAFSWNIQVCQAKLLYVQLRKDKYWAVFTCVRFGFVLPRKAIGWKNLASLRYPIRSKSKTNRDALAQFFPRFVSAKCPELQWVLIGSLDCLCPLWLAGVITFIFLLKPFHRQQLLIDYYLCLK